MINYEKPDSTIEIIISYEHEDINDVFVHDEAWLFDRTILYCVMFCSIGGVYQTFVFDTLKALSILLIVQYAFLKFRFSKIFLIIALEIMSIMYYNYKMFINVQYPLTLNYNLTLGCVGILFMLIACDFGARLTGFGENISENKIFLFVVAVISYVLFVCKVYLIVNTMSTYYNLLIMCGVVYIMAFERKIHAKSVNIKGILNALFLFTVLITCILHLNQIHIEYFANQINV